LRFARLTRNIFKPDMESDITQTDALWKLWAWFEKNKKQVIYGTTAAAAVALIAWFFVWRAHEKQVEASEALARVSLAHLLEPSGANQDDSQAFLKVASEHSGTSAAERAALLAAASLFTQGKYADAQAQFGRFIRENGASQFVPQAKLGVAASLEAQGKTTEAVNQYKEVSERHPNSVAAPQAKISLGRIYEAQNQPQQARKIYEELARSDAGTSLGSEASMRLEELNAKFPPSVATNSAAVLQPGTTATKTATPAVPATATPAQPAKK
jgi:predicted negative regulator of RcsB-dependent stress response